MKTMPLSEVKTKLSALVDAAERRDEVVTITRNGKPVAIIVSNVEHDGWQETVEIMRDAKFMKEIRKGILSLKRTKKRYTLMSSSATELFTCPSACSKSRPRLRPPFPPAVRNRKETPPLVAFFL
jgi:prevent-host-death family protein